MGCSSPALRPKSCHVLPSGIEQMLVSFAHRRCDVSLWPCLIRRSITQGVFLDFSVLGDVNLQDFGTTHTRRPAQNSIQLMLYQQLCMLITDFPQLLGLLRALLVKQGYFLPFGANFMLKEPGDSGMSLVSVKRFQHSGNANVSHGTTHSPYRGSFEVTKWAKPLLVA